MVENSNVDLGLSNLTLSFHSSQLNEISVVYLLANIPMLVATIAINLWVIKVIKGKEKNRINSLIVWDCFTGVYTLGYHSTVLGNPLSLSLILCTLGPDKVRGLRSESKHLKGCIGTRVGHGTFFDQDIWCTQAVT